MPIVLWSRSTASWNQSIPGFALWIFFFFLISVYFITDRKGVWGAGREGGKEHQQWSFLLPLLPFLLPCGSWEICARPGVGVAIILQFLRFSPLVLVVLTWVVGHQDVGCGEPFMATHAPGKRSVCSMSVLCFGGRQCSEQAKMVPYFLYFQTSSPWAYDVSSTTLLSLSVKWGK